MPTRDQVASTVRRNINANLLEQLAELETDKALLTEELKLVRQQNAQLAGLVKSLQAELAASRAPEPELAPALVAAD